MGLNQINSITNHNNVLLDWILVSEAEESSIISSRFPLSLIDPHHVPVEIVLDFTAHPAIAEAPSIQQFNFLKADYCGLNEYFRHMSFEERATNLPVDAITDLLYNDLELGFERCVPKTLHKKSSHPPWVGKHLLNLKNRKNKAFKRYSKTRTATNYNTYSALRAEYQVTQKYYMDRYTERIQQNFISNPSSFWSYVRLKKRTSNLPSTMSLGDQTASGLQEICNMFAQHFNSNYTSESDMAQPTWQTTQIVDINGITLSQAEVHHELSNIDTKKSKGPDNIPPIVLRNCADSLAGPLTLLFNKSLSEGVFPARLNEAFVLPIFKAGVRTDINNYRGVAILPIITKIFEKLVRKSIFEKAKNVIPSTQHGFMPGRSTVTNLVSFTNSVINEIERGKQVDVLFTDFTKAFDRVQHKLLISNFELMGLVNTLSSG